jgi:hypothetical protein
MAETGFDQSGLPDGEIGPTAGYWGVGPLRRLLAKPGTSPRRVKVVPCPGCDRRFRTSFQRDQHRAQKGH